MPMPGSHLWCELTPSPSRDKCLLPGICPYSDLGLQTATLLVFFQRQLAKLLPHSPSLCRLLVNCLADKSDLRGQCISLYQQLRKCHLCIDDLLSFSAQLCIEVCLFPNSCCLQGPLLWRASLCCRCFVLTMSAHCLNVFSS